MGRIRVLPDSLVNKIAAGEVVERPASVLKELLENGIDAGATRIDVTVEDGGKRLVRVADDGCGMTEGDVALAVEPHATSKIASEADLFRVATMGFRGEALASIASVSQLRIVSRVADEPGGYEIGVAGGRIEGPRPAATSPGTTVEVRELFFNVPARRKFLRTTNTEMGHLTEQLVRIGLAHPHVHLTCKHNGRGTHDLPAHGGPDAGQALRRRIVDLFSPELAEALIEIDRRERGLRVFGWVAPPARTRATGAWQYTWLNGRFIRDRFILHAVREAYRGLLPEGRFPVVFLFLETEPGEVDVNVHPTKIEVRFRDSNLVHSQVLAALREPFLRRDLTPALAQEALGGPARQSAPPRGASPPAGAGGADPARTAAQGPETLSPDRQQQVRQAMADFLKQAPPTRSRPDDATGPPAALDQSRPTPTVGPASGTLRERLGGDLPVETNERHAGPAFAAPAAKAIQLHNTYLVAETEDGLIIVDQHALHERIIYQQLVDRISRGRLESQHLLLPETIDVTPAELAGLESFGELFERLGLEVSRFGPTSVAVHAVPSALSDADVGDWVGQLLGRLADKPDQAVSDEFLHELLDMMACKAAVKAGDVLTTEEIASMLARRTAVEKASACPHGRPTALRLTIHELEKQFKRT